MSGDEHMLRNRTLLAPKQSVHPIEILPATTTYQRCSMAVQTQALQQPVRLEVRNAEPASGPSLRFSATQEKPGIHHRRSTFACPGNWRDNRGLQRDICGRAR